jgi:penicillin-binding protein 1A
LSGKLADDITARARPHRASRECEDALFKFIRRSTIRLLSAGFSAALFGLVGAFFALWIFGRDLPDHRQLAAYEPPIVSRVYAADGRLIGEFASEKRIFVPYGSIPKRVVHAFIAAEDQRFFVHPGIDLFGIARAVRSNITAAPGRRLHGGSTITQQVAKNFLLTPERSLDRKIREMMLALRIERAYPKQRILELYLNQIFLGHQAYGVAAAAQVYFGKALGELTIAESAFLAALPQAPSRFNPRRNAKEAVARRNYIVRRMLDDGYITNAEADGAQAAPLGVKPPPPYVSIGAEYFVAELRREMLAKHGEEKMRAGGYVIRATLDPKLQALADEALRRGLVAYDRRHGWRGPIANLKDGRGWRWLETWRQGLRDLVAPAGHGDWLLAIVLEVQDGGVDFSTADGRRGRIPLAELVWARKQGEIGVEAGRPPFKTATGPPIRKAGDVLREGDVVLVERVAIDGQNKPYPANTYALRQVPEVNGALVAMDPHTGRVLAMSGGFSFWLSQYNTATQAWRQPGSSFKPYVYLAALQEGFTPSTIILDAPSVVKIGTTIYRPRNYSGKFYGPVTMRAALEQSLNGATLRLAEATGFAAVAAFATKLGVAEAIEPVPAMALGAIETTPLRHVAGYAMIANGGRLVSPTLVDRIQDRYGRTIYRHDMRACPNCGPIVFSGQTMPAVVDARVQVLDPGNAYQMITLLQSAARRSPAVAALDRRVAGKTGTTNNSLDAWFVGFASDLVVAVWVGFDNPRSLGPNETGSAAAAPIFAAFMRPALDLVPARAFGQPPDLVAIRTGEGFEYYKRGTEPGTGKGRVLDTAMAKPGEFPEVGNGIDKTY